MGFGQPSVGFCGLFVSFPQTLGCSFGALFVYSPDGGLLVGIWWALVGFRCVLDFIVSFGVLVTLVGICYAGSGSCGLLVGSCL